MDCSLPSSSVHGISQARILEWVAISSSGGSSWPRDGTQISCIAKFPENSASPLSFSSPFCSNGKPRMLLSLHTSHLDVRERSSVPLMLHRPPTPTTPRWRFQSLDHWYSLSRAAPGSRVIFMVCTICYSTETRTSEDLARSLMLCSDCLEIPNNDRTVLLWAPQIMWWILSTPYRDLICCQDLLLQGNWLGLLFHFLPHSIPIPRILLFYCSV